MTLPIASISMHECYIIKRNPSCQVLSGEAETIAKYYVEIAERVWGRYGGEIWGHILKYELLEE